MRKWLAAGAAVLGMAAFPAGAMAADEALRSAIAADYEANLWPLFEHLHRNPELSGKEVKTAERLADELKRLGYQVTEGVGGTGVVAVMKNGAGPTVLLRADMDGLPVEEKSGLPYSSKVRQADYEGVERPVMHACGHDVHVTALVGAARQLAARKAAWSGTLVLIGQPAEERVHGARDMLRDGLYTRFPKPEYALAFHVSADHASGKIEVPLKIVASSADAVDIVVHGVGTHGASPHKGVDPVLVAAHIVVGLQSVISRSINPLQPGVITVGSIHGGSKGNIIGDQVRLQLTVRSNDFEVRKQLIAGIERVARGVAQSYGAPAPEVIVSKTETTPPTINDGTTAAKIKARFTEHFPAGTVIETPPDGMGAEDFAYFVAPDTGVKGVYFSVGGTPADKLAGAPTHHSPLFKIEPEPSVKTGVEAMVVGAMALMPKGGTSSASGN